MSLFDKQNLKNGDNSEANQAGRDVIKIKNEVNNYGISYKDVKEIFDDLLDLKFTEKIEEALKQASINTQQFFKELEIKLKDNIGQIVKEKFSDPDVIFDLSNAINITARKGSKININALTDLLITRLSRNSNEILDQVCSDAINIIPKLTKQQLDFLAISFYLKHYKSPKVQTFSDLEFDVKKLNKFYLSIENMSGASRFLLLSYGLCLHSSTFSLNPFHVIAKRKNLSDYKEGSGNAKGFYIHNAPTTFELLKIYDDQNGINYTITTVGDLIAIIHLNNEAPHLNIKIEEWIN